MVTEAMEENPKLQTRIHEYSLKNPKLDTESFEAGYRQALADVVDYRGIKVPEEGVHCAGCAVELKDS
jgi:hypothetical protein